MKIYTIIAGIDGVGKTSLLGALDGITNSLGRLVSTDESAMSCVSHGVCLTQETTLSGHMTAQTARNARELGYYVRMFYVGLDSADESVLRIANRVRKGGHDIPNEDVFRRFAGRVKSLADVLPYCDECTFFDNNNGFVEVGTYRNGEIICNAHPPKWLSEIADAINMK